jgi:hypothetical protein
MVGVDGFEAPSLVGGANFRAGRYFSAPMDDADTGSDSRHFRPIEVRCKAGTYENYLSFLHVFASSCST